LRDYPTMEEQGDTTGMKHFKDMQVWDAGRSDFYAWLDRTSEAALEPDLEIIDVHHHMWDKRELRGANANGLERQQCYMTDDLVHDFVGGGHKVTHSVFVTARAFYTANAQPAWMAPLGEIQFAQGIAAQFESGRYGCFRGAAAIIGFADLAAHGAEVEPLLMACKQASPNYRGIKITCSHDEKTDFKFYPRPHMYSQPKFREGFVLLEKHGLLFEAWLFSSQLPDLLDLAKAFPNTTIVLLHAGTPIAALGDVAGAPAYDGKQHLVVAEWQENMRAIAEQCPNVVVKIGGMGLPFLGTDYSQRKEGPPSSAEVAASFRDMYLWTVETFGAQRCMLWSNFPVDKISMSYTVYMNALKQITSELPERDRALLFSGTAKRVYRLT